ncbi:MAG: tripartite tricarboxylate transporter substrate binding protein [Betaproteobacteria bacterium]|nr:tripartite tricarboxylate transporter substrate binding protein [Betaproteobacteria bacterium]
MSIHPVALLVIASLVGTSAVAQSYPAKPVRFVVPSATGGAYEVILRAMQPMLHEELGQALVIENKPGGGGVVGLEFVARADPDGYTILQGGISQIVLNPLFVGKVPYDTQKDFVHIAMMGELVMALYAHQSLEVNNLKGLVDYAKANPGKVGYGSSGIGQSFHLAGEMLKLRTGADFVHVPYKGTAQALQDFFAGRLLMMFYPPNGVIMDRIKKGEIRPVAAMSDKRLANLPDVPTFEELGVGNLGVSGWGGFSGPAKLPRPIVQRINQAVNKVSTRPEVVKSLDSMTMVPLRTTPEEMTEKVRREIAFWTEMVAKLGIKPGS